MSAAIVPFPLTRRRKFISRQANRASELNAAASERHILNQLKIQADVMRRRGIDEDLIAHELECMESAIRSALWRADVTPGVL
jgi:hypothetical protein